MRGLLFDDTAKSICLAFKVPYDYAGGDLEIHLLAMHTGVEVNSDAIQWTADYIAVCGINRDSGHPGDTQTLAKTSTQITSSTPIGFAVGVVGSTPWNCVLTLREDDPSNPLTVAQSASRTPAMRPVMVFAEILRTTVGGAGLVGNVMLCHAWVEYNAYVGILP